MSLLWNVTEFLPGIWSLSPIGGLIGMIIMTYWLLSSGRLVPKSSHEREMSLERKRADEWKETAMDQRDVNQEIREQNTMLLESARITAKFFSDVNTDIEDTRTG